MVKMNIYMLTAPDDIILRMADRALLAGYPRPVVHVAIVGTTEALLINQSVGKGFCWSQTI